MVSGRDGRLIVASKNGTDNVYSQSGHYLLLKHLRDEFPEGYQVKYRQLIRFLQHNKLSLGCEVIANCLGEHGEVPKTEHVVVNAREFRLIIPGMYIFQDAQVFYSTYDKFRWDFNARWCDIHDAMKREAWKHIDMEYDRLHSDLLEGFVAYWIPKEDVAFMLESNGDEGLGLLGLASLEQTLDPLVSSTSQPTQEQWPTLESLLGDAGQMDTLYAEVGRILERETGDRVLSEAREATSKKESMQKLREEFRMLMANSRPRIFDNDMVGYGGVSFMKMISALEQLRLPHELKVSRPASSQSPLKKESFNEFLVTVHVLQDSAFPKYEKYRQENEDENLPPLLRGYTWYISFLNEEEEQDRPSKKACLEQQQEEETLLDMDTLLSHGPLEGSVWKFKVVSYMIRTFLYRNLGSVLAKNGNKASFLQSTERLIESWAPPMSVKEELYKRATLWADSIMALSPDERNDLARGKYLSVLRSHLDVIARGQGAVASSQEEVGIYFLISLHPWFEETARLLSDHLAHRTGFRRNVLKPEDLSMENAVLLAGMSGVVFGQIGDGHIFKVARLISKLPLKTRAAVVVMHAVSLEHADAECDRRGLAADADERKKLKGLCASVMDHMDRLQTSLGSGACFQLLSISEGEGDDRNQSCERIMAAMRAARERMIKPPKELVQGGRGSPFSTIHIVMFVTVVGWGKNAICDKLEAIHKQSLAGGGGGLHGLLGLPEGELCVLEGDHLKKTFWTEVEKVFRRKSMNLLILNRNFPPNSWATSLSKLDKAGKMAGRSFHVSAALPYSQATSGYAFGLADLAVCLQSVQMRRNHGTSLDGEQSQETCKVTSMFFNFYNYQDWETLAQSVRTQLTRRVAVVPWLKEGAEEELARHEELSASVQLVATMPQGMFNLGHETSTRDCLARPKHQELLSSLRLRTSFGVSGMQDIAPRYASIDLDQQSVVALVHSVSSHVPEDIARRLQEYQQSSARRRYHVTLWHSQSHAVELLQELSEFKGAAQVISPALLVADEYCIALSVRVLSNALSPTVPCYNQFPHVTLWCVKPDMAKHSNELIEAAVAGGDNGGDSPRPFTLDLQELQDDVVRSSLCGTVRWHF
ncbi:hypothetical protein GUITHDRAFT_106740 [Guillardia theta CCMP2712]|uniref:tRNA ligase phosphodiesterase domain-containing protein n=3 Tax=Guillardia theta TaxID=55529 RepID=L1JGU2_GUITC|nr:hypothetical protein GUITHDRAFT_106740 [Guillardia theta CCMP2712]EKX47290.1 hypothetical protein GUITHDRAFT_106740 [Guillardia theta CCMP2712]|eukprot:XP_005834270.1 hypothetical protein GUITHDRAFT_106740 [Guillardia theta CCMP2712]